MNYYEQTKLYPENCGLHFQIFHDDPLHIYLLIYYFPSNIDNSLFVNIVFQYTLKVPLHV